MKKIEIELTESMHIELVCTANRLHCSESDLTNAIFLNYFWWNDEALKILEENAKKPLN